MCVSANPSNVLLVTFRICFGQMLPWVTSLAVRHLRLIQAQIHTTRSFFREPGFPIAEETPNCLIVREQGRGVDAGEFSFLWNSMAFNMQYHSGFHWFWRDGHSICPNLGMEIGEIWTWVRIPSWICANEANTMLSFGYCRQRILLGYTTMYKSSTHHLIKLYTSFLLQNWRASQDIFRIMHHCRIIRVTEFSVHQIFKSWIVNNQTIEQRFWKPRPTFALNGANFPVKLDFRRTVFDLWRLVSTSARRLSQSRGEILSNPPTYQRSPGLWIFRWWRRPRCTFAAIISRLRDEIGMQFCLNQYSPAMWCEMVVTWETLHELRDGKYIHVPQNTSGT